MPFISNTPDSTFRRHPPVPCKDCPDRVAGCHGSCEKYKAWQAANSADYKLFMDTYRGERMVEQHEQASKMRTLKRQHRWNGG